MCGVPVHILEHRPRYKSAWFFFSSRSRHTRWTGAWSSDVCSSDLPGFAAVELGGERALEQHRRCDHCAGKERGMPIDHRALCVVQQLRRGPPRAKALRKPCEPLHRVHRVGLCADGRDALVADPVHFLSSTSGLSTLTGLPARYASTWSNAFPNWIS